MSSVFCFADLTAKVNLQQKGKIQIAAKAGKCESLWPGLHSAETADWILCLTRWVKYVLPMRVSPLDLILKLGDL